MRSLSACDILHVWEQGQRQHPVDRALTLLAAACPEMRRDEFAALSIGQRDALLFSLREQTFGSTLNGFAECPQCAERLEFTIPAADVQMTPPQFEEEKRELEMIAGGLVLRFRLPDSLDLAAAAGCEEVDTARRLLVQRCVLQANRDGEPISCSELPDEVINQLAERMSEWDPQAEVLLDLTCPACGHRWKTIFDIVSFFWTEICVQAKRLLREVHTLAQAYGWREADILSMSAVRRQFYLEMVT